MKKYLPSKLGPKKRLEHVGIKHVILGLSEDLIQRRPACRCSFDVMSLDRGGIIAVSMPGSEQQATTERSALAEALNIFHDPDRGSAAF